MTATAEPITPEAVREFLAPYQQAWDTLRSQRAAGDAWGWVRTCMHTRDEDAGAAGLASEHLAVPNKPHLRVFTWAWYAVKLLQVDKSRQLMVTWMCCGLTVHEAMFTNSAKIGYQHITGADTAEKIQKYMLYILQAQPHELMLPWVEERDHPPHSWVERVAGWFGLSMQPTIILRADHPSTYSSPAYLQAKALTNQYRTSSSAEGVIEVVLKPFFEADERTIEAIPAGPGGPNKWRGSTRSRAVEDEAWFHQQLAKNVNSAKQSTGQNGRQTLVSTANRGEDGDDYPLEMIERASIQPEFFGGYHGAAKKRASEMPPGVEIWQTKFGYTHIRIWYHADPDKRSKQWYKDNVETGDRKQNAREVLIDYSQSSGNPFYEVFNEATQGVPARIPPKRSRFVVCMDGGRRPAAILLEVSANGRVLAAAECVTDSKRSSNVTVLADRMESEWSVRFPGWQKEAVIVVDPSMFDTRGETSDETSADVLHAKGWWVEKGSLNLETRYRAVQKLCLENVVDEYGKGPRLVVDINHCPVLYAALVSGCVVPKSAEGSGNYVKEKNNYSHPVDALEYGATYLMMGVYEEDEEEDTGLVSFETRR